MSKASRLARPPPAGAGSRLPSPRKDCPGGAGRARLGSGGGGGERLMRAGSDGVPARQKPGTAAVTQDQTPPPAETQAPGRAPAHKSQDVDVAPPRSRTGPPRASSLQPAPPNKQPKRSLKVTSPEDAESPNGTRGEARGSRAVPRRHTLGGARSSRDVLAMQPSDMDKKREAFLEHLKHKYPHHASAIMGHQERLREQSRSPKHGAHPGPGAAEHLDHLSLASLESLDAMSECDAPTGFTRGSRVRASLPVVRSTNQTKDRSLGVLYLQYGDETKQIRMPNEVTSVDTIRALFVSAFPQQLTMKMLESPSVAVYVKDDMRNMYYELADVRNITDHSCLKVYHKDPAQAFSHGPRPANGDSRMHSEMPHPLRHPPMGPPPHHPMQGALPPPSPSRIPFGPRQGPPPGSATMPRDRLSSANPPARSVSPCPSAILERRDVKPDEDVGGKSLSLSRGSEGLYADPYLLQEGRVGVASAHGPHAGAGLDGPDHGLGGFHRASIRSTSSYGGPSPTDTVDHPALYRQKSRSSQLPTLGSKTPPPSPHRMADVRIIDLHGVPPHGVPPHGVPPHGAPPHGIPPHGVPPHGVPPHGVPPHGVPPHGVPPHGAPIERSSPVRQSFRKEEAAGSKPRNTAGVPDLQGPVQGPVPAAGDQQTRERMKAMEQQIASLTGLVQHALLKGPNTSGTKEPASDRPATTASPAHSAHSSGDSPVLTPKNPAAPTEKSSAPLKVSLLQFRKNVSDLRTQLHQMRQLQLQNQEALRVQLKRAEQEIGVKLSEWVQRADDPVQKQRHLVEEDRHKYLGLEECVLTQLGELEQYVDGLQGDPAAAHRVVTLKAVEDGALTLRRVGESLAGLKGEFPALQTRMRAVLRVEVEAVKFLKEEPHKLDSMLKRVKSLTDALSSLRRTATELPQKVPDPPISSSAAAAEAPAESPPAPQSSTVRSEVMPPSPVVVHHVQSAPVHKQQSQQSAALTAQPSPPPPPSPTQPPCPPVSRTPDRESPRGAAPGAQSPAGLKKTPGGSQDLVIEELQNSQDKSKSRAMSIEAAEKEWEERRQNMGQYDGKDFEKYLQEAQANMMKGIPNLELEGHAGAPPDAAVQQQEVHSPGETPAAELQPPAHKQARKVPEKLPKPAPDKPAKAASRPAAPEGLARQGSDKARKSPPPPPPPRKTYPGSGMTTTRSGEVVFTCRKESVSAQEGEDEAPPPSPQPKPAKVTAEAKAAPPTPPPVAAAASREDEDEGDKIMAELQVFQKCTVKDVGTKHLVEPAARVEPQIRELRSGALLPLREKKNSEPTGEEKAPDTDENGNTTVRQSQGVIYYVTGKIPQPPSSETEDPPEHREPPQPPTQVSNVNANDNSPSQEQQQLLPPPPPPKSPVTPPPISPKPVGLNGFKLPKKHGKRSESLKTGAEIQKGKVLNKASAEKKSKVAQEQLASGGNGPPESAAAAAAAPKEAPKQSAASLKRTSKQTAEPPRAQPEDSDDGAGLSPDLPGDEAPPPPDNIAFMITNTKVQPLSCGEYQELVNAKKGSVQTVTVGSAAAAADATGPQDNGFSKKPVIIIFDEPMDIRSAYKRLSTIFECEEELDRMLSEERIDEESEESDGEQRGGRQPTAADGGRSDRAKSLSLSSSSMSDSGGQEESSSDGKQDGKKKFKFKFPKKQLAALTQAIRTGTKSGKKTLQVVVYEDEEESDGTIKQHKEAKRFEIARSKSLAEAPRGAGSVTTKRQNSDAVCRTDEIRKNTYKTLDSLEQTIKQLETTITEMGPRSPDEPISSEEAGAGSGKGSEGVGLKRSSSLPTSRGPGLKGPSKSALQKKTKPQLYPRPVALPSSSSSSGSSSGGSSSAAAPSVPGSVQQNTSVASPTSRMPVPLSAKSRQSSGTTDKAGKQPKLQDAQRQFRQANGSAKRVGGDHKTASPTLPTSKIPAFYPSSAKGSSQSAANADATNPINPSSSSSSSSSVTKSSSLSSHAPRSSSSSSSSSSHIPSLSNGSLKLPTPSQHAGKALSFSSQTQNGRAHSSSSSSSFSSSSSSSSPSPLSPTPLGQGGKSIRTIHTPSFTSYRSHNGSGGKSCIPTATAAKDST